MINQCNAMSRGNFLYFMFKISVESCPLRLGSQPSRVQIVAAFLAAYCDAQISHILGASPALTKQQFQSGFQSFGCLYVAKNMIPFRTPVGCLYSLSSTSWGFSPGARTTLAAAFSSSNALFHVGVLQIVNFSGSICQHDLSCRQPSSHLCQMEPDYTDQSDLG